MADGGGKFSFFWSIHVRINIKIDISFFHKTYNRQIWQTGTYRVFDSSEIKQAGSADVILSRSRG